MKTEEEEEETETQTDSKSLENDPKIQRFRKYLRLAGLRIVKNSELEALKSKKARYEFLKKIFADAGFKDKSLSIKSCQKFKLKREREREIAELDVGNIIQSTPGRTTRNALRSSTAKVLEENKSKNPHVRLKKINIERDSDEDEEMDESDSNEKSNQPFSNIKDLIESDQDESDSDKKKKNKTSNQTSKKIVDSEDEEE